MVKLHMILTKGKYFFVTISFDICASSSFTSDMRDKYAYISDTLEKVDENIHIICVNPEAYIHHHIKD